MQFLFGFRKELRNIRVENLPVPRVTALHSGIIGQKGRRLSGMGIHNVHVTPVTYEVHPPTAAVEVKK